MNKTLYSLIAASTLLYSGCANYIHGTKEVGDAIANLNPNKINGKKEIPFRLLSTEERTKMYRLEFEEIKR